MVCGWRLKEKMRMRVYWAYSDIVVLPSSLNSLANNRKIYSIVVPKVRTERIGAYR